MATQCVIVVSFSDYMHVVARELAVLLCTRTFIATKLANALEEKRAVYT